MPSPLTGQLASGTDDFMEPLTAVVTLCLEGLQAELAGKREEAHALYLRAWTSRADAYDACVAAHYLARTQKDASGTHAWNLTALGQAALADDARVRAFLPSLHLNAGHSCEMIGDQAQARAHYELAAEAVWNAPNDEYGAMLREGIASALMRVAERP